MDAEYYKKYEPFFGEWYITRFIGKGSYGTVFEIERRDALDGETYHSALKVISIPVSDYELHETMEEHDLTQQDAVQFFTEEAKNINHEIKLMSRVKAHSNIVSYEDHKVYQQSNGIGWDILIRMELLTPITQHFKKLKRVPRREIIRLGIDLCRALEVCQKYNIIHRDIKPANIFVSEDGNYKLGDFGVARTSGKSTGASTFAGTSSYMAPEIFRYEKYTSNVDIYSLGLVLYQLLNDNRLPFYPPYPQSYTANDIQMAQARRIAGAPLPTPANADGRLAEIVLKACSPNPADRYDSPAQMRQELEAIQYTEQEGQLIWPYGDDQLRVADSTRSTHRTATQTVPAAPQQPAAPVAPVAGDATTRLPFGNAAAQPAGDKTVQAASAPQQTAAPAPQPETPADDKTVLLFKAQEEERRRKEEAARQAEEERRRKAAEEKEAELARIREEKRVEEARRFAAEQAAKEETARKAQEEAAQQQEEEARRKKQEEEAQKLSRRKMLKILGGAAALTVLGNGAYWLYSWKTTQAANISGTFENLTWKLTAGSTLTISGRGPIAAGDNDSYPWSQYSDSVQELVLEEGITQVNRYAFRSFTKLVHIQLPDSLKTVGYGCFYRCTSLTSCTIPEGVTLIGAYAFAGCTSLASCTIPETVTQIGAHAFAGCTSLTSCTIPEKVTTIGAYAFAGCTSLTSCTIPKTVTGIDKSAFSNCGLTSVTISQDCNVYKSAFDKNVTIRYYD